MELHPHLQTVRVNYAQALQFAGRLDEALAQYQIASIIAPDVPWLRALEGACLAALGRRDDAQAMLAGLEALRHSEYVDAYHMAVFRSALRRPREALAELERAYAENSAWLYTLDVDPLLDACGRSPGSASWFRAAAPPDRPRSLRRGVLPPARTGPAAHFCRFLTLSGAGSDANVRPDKSACRNNRCAICNIWSRSKGRWRSIADLCEGARRHAGRRARHGGGAGGRAEKRTMLERMRTHITTLVGRYKR